MEFLSIQMYVFLLLFFTRIWSNIIFETALQIESLPSKSYSAFTAFVWNPSEDMETQLIIKLTFYSSTRFGFFKICLGKSFTISPISEQTPGIIVKRVVEKICKSLSPWYLSGAFLLFI